MKKSILLSCLCFQAIALANTDLSFYFDDVSAYDASIPKPKDVLGFEVGEWHVRHDQLVQYMMALAGSSDRVSLQEIGRTHEHRPLLNLIISSKENMNRIDALRKAHVAAALGQAEGDVNLPLVVYLGYSIHGNEPSGSNTSMLMAYHLAASKNVDTLLKNTIVIIDPSMNPDGLSRFAQWANMHKGRELVANRWHREHAEHWPSGRTNHYWYDLNRDWLLLQHPESRARVAQFHRWRPNILGDFHEMGTGSSYFFQPGVPSRQNPLTPDQNLNLTRTIARYHAKALDSEGVPYFSEQQFDDFYYGKGSTYPDIQGCIGILFEQASSRGHLQENSYGTLTFPQTIKNQLTTSMSTLQAGLENRSAIKAYQTSFFKEVHEKVKKNPVKAFVFGGSSDPFKTQKMAEILTKHQVKIYELAKPVTVQGRRWDQGYVVPCNQDQYLLIQSVFQQETDFNDNTFYDVSTWHFPSAFGVPFDALNQKQFSANLLGQPFNAQQDKAFPAKIGEKDLGFVLDWRHHLTPKITYQLLDQGYRVRGSMEPFTATTSVGEISFGYGTILVLQGTQDRDASDLMRILNDAAQMGVPVYGLKSGLTNQGHDLGSRSFVPLQRPKIMLVVGRGVSTGEAGEMWHLLDHRFGMQVALIDMGRLSSNIMEDFTHVIMVDGAYGSIGDGTTEEIRNWTRKGGVLITVKRAAQWAAEKGLVQTKVQSAMRPKTDEKTKKKPERLPYGERSARRALTLISGTIFAAELDLTHPIGFGYESPQIALFRNHNRVMELSDNAYSTVASYTANPLMSGYVSETNLNRLKESAAIIAESYGGGTVVALMDNPTFRGFWLGTQRLLLNAIFFGDAI